MAIDCSHVQILVCMATRYEQQNKKISSFFVSRICACVILPSCLCPSHPLLLRPPPLHTLPLGRYISWSREEHSLCFCSNWMRWAELCQCPYHLLLRQGAGRGRYQRVEEEERGRKVEWAKGVLLLPEILIRLRRWPLSQYSQNRQDQRGSVWHTGNVIVTVGVSLEWTNHCFTWLNRVQKRHSRGQEQSLIIYREMKAKRLIHWPKMLPLYACK